MNLNSLSMLPKYQAPSSWWEHVPIAHWLVEHLQPKIIIELGTHYGVSFFSFCEAASLLSPESFIYAVDTWEGDKHAGNYDETVYKKVVNHQQAHHKQRSRIVRSTFDDAATHFADGTIDLLHIDGLHTYAAVSHDYNTWAPKLKDNGSILFHDWNVRESDFGVWQLWGEVKKDERFQCIEIPNGHGLAIATLCASRPSWHHDLLAALPNLTCKGALLDQLSTLGDRNERLKSQLAESMQHSKNLEQQTLQLQLEVDQYRGDIQKLAQQGHDLVAALTQAQKGFKARFLNRLSRMIR